jgi:electron transport complex protein RnfC
MLMVFKLHEFHGGMHLAEHKNEALAGGLRQAGLPGRLILPLKQHVGDANKPLVKPGERVLRNQLIADNSSPFSSPIHAPTSGKISTIDEFPVPHPSGQPDTCIIIDVDGKDEAVHTEHESNAVELEPFELIRKIQQAGVVGLGGAVFPSSAKLSRGNANGIDVLIINGAECEPYICCDDMLMQANANELVRGIFYLQRILSPKQTLIGIEDNKPKAVKAVEAALKENPLEHTRVISIPTIYPSGGEKQLIQILTGKEVPRGELAFDIGIFCQNVGTCVAIARALDINQPLISRIVTLSGDGIKQPGNWEVLLGTPIRYLIEQAGGYVSNDNTAQHLVMGGPMMGFSLAGDDIPIVKATNNILVMQHQTIPQSPGYHDECIRCGQCAEVCPVKLLPQQLYWQARAKNYERCEEYHLFDCIECG